MTTPSEPPPKKTPKEPYAEPLPGIEGVYRIAVPTPYPVGRVNCYLLLKGEPALIDTGVESDRAFSHLEASLALVRVKPSDLRSVLITHGHPDHFGAARRIVEASKARVFLHRYDEPKILATGGDSLIGATSAADYFRAAGVPQEFLDTFEDVLQAAAGAFARQVERGERLEDGDTLEAGGVRLKTFHFPGHTSGMLNFFAEREGVLFSGDHILPRITPNPVLDLRPFDGEPKFRSLVHYLKSIDRAGKLPVRWVLPGHGRPFEDFQGCLERMRAHHEERKNLLLSFFADGEKTIHELIGLLFPHLPDSAYFLCLSEVTGHLEVLEEERLVRKLERDGILRFEAARPRG